MSTICCPLRWFARRVWLHAARTSGSTWQCFSNQGGGCPCDPFMVPCFCWTRSFRQFVLVLLLNFPHHLRTLCCDSIVFSFSVWGSSTEVTFLSTWTHIRCFTFVSMKLNFPGYFCPLVRGTRRSTLSPTSYSGRARSSIEKKAGTEDTAEEKNPKCCGWHLMLVVDECQTLASMSARLVIISASCSCVCTLLIEMDFSKLTLSNSHAMSTRWVR